MPPTRPQDRAPHPIRRTLAVALAATLAVALSAGARQDPPRPRRSVALVQVSPPAPNLYGLPDHDDRGEGHVRAVVGLATSPSVLAMALGRVEAPSLRDQDDPAAALCGMLAVAARPGTGLVEVAVEAPTAAESAALADAVVAALMDAEGAYGQAVARNRADRLEAHLGRMKRESDELARMLRELAADHRADAVELDLIRGRHDRMMAMQDAVERRLDQDRFAESWGVRVVRVGKAAPR